MNCQAQSIYGHTEPGFGEYGALYGYYGQQDGIYYFVTTAKAGGEIYPGYEFGMNIILAAPEGEKPYTGQLVLPEIVQHPAYPGAESTIFSTPLKYTVGEAFANSDIEEVVLSRNCAWGVGKNAFAGCSKLTTITLPYNDCPYMLGPYFHGCPISRINASPNTPIIINGVFNGTHTTHFDFTELNVSIYSEAFSGSEIKNLTISGDARLEAYAFSSCNTLRSVHFVGTAGPDNPLNCPFGYNPNLEELICEWETPPSGMLYLNYRNEPEWKQDEQDKKANLKIYVPDKSIELYRQSDCWKDYQNILPLSTLSVNSTLESNARNVKRIDTYDIYGRHIDINRAKGPVISHIIYEDGTSEVKKQILK